MRIISAVALFLAFVGLSSRASAQLFDAGPDDTPRVDGDPRWAVGLDAYGGIAVQSGSDEARAHSLGGGLLKARWRYVQVGAFAELTDVVIDQWRTFGGLAGAYVPFTRWVDFDASVGVASRRYMDTDARYGPGGYSLDNPLLVWRVGVSDRSSEAIFGARVGAQLFGSIDLSRKSAPWRRVFRDETGDQDVVEGVTRVGGVSVGLSLSVGLDVGPDRTAQN